MQSLEFFYDCSSPWTYLAFESVQKLRERTPVDVRYRPVLVGGVFNSVNAEVYASRANPHPVKSRYYSKDLADWAAYVGVEIGSPDVFPVNSVKAMRGALVALEHDLVVSYSRCVFRTYWSELKDIAQPEVLQSLVREVGLPEDEFFQKIGQPEYKDALRQNTQELIERGGFGSPTFFVGATDMYFGNDRLPLVESKLRMG